MPTMRKPRRAFKGLLTDTDRWQQFVHRSGDVFVCTPIKCGTTWTTAIVSMLCQGRIDVVPAETVPWFDSKLVRIREVVGP